VVLDETIVLERVLSQIQWLGWLVKAVNKKKKIFEDIYVVSHADQLANTKRVSLPCVWIERFQVC
jgi:hypothetical protein